MNHHVSYLRIALAICAVAVFAAAQVPVINPSGVVEAASFTNRIAAGGMASIFGANLAPSAFVANTIPLPTIMNTVTVTLDGTPCPLLYVSPNQINFQVRWEVLSLNTTNLIVKTANGQSNTYPIALSPTAAGMFALSQPGQGAILISGTSTYAAPVGSIAGATSRPAVAGEFVSIYASGLGDVSKQPADGTVSPSAPNLATVKVTPIQVAIGGNAAAISFAGLAPGFVALYQIDVKVPAGVSGPALNVTLNVNGVNASFVQMAVQ